MTGTSTVIVHDYQLSLAIGKEGQNARLAARLTGWRIDIKSETQLAEEEEYANQEWAEGEWVLDEASNEMVWQAGEGGGGGGGPGRGVERDGVAAGGGRRGDVARAVEPRRRGVDS